MPTAAARGKATEVGETLQQLQEFHSRPGEWWREQGYPTRPASRNLVCAGPRGIPRPTSLDPERVPPVPAPFPTPRPVIRGAAPRSTTRARGTLSQPMLTLGQRVQHPRLLQVPSELLALRVGGLRRHGGSVPETRGPEQEEGAGSSANPASASLPQAPKTCARTPTPTRSRPEARHRPHAPSHAAPPSLCNGP